MKTVVVGCGNLLAGDDGVGIHVVRELAPHLEEVEGVDVVEVAAGGMGLLDVLVGYHRAVLVDATDGAGSRPGEVRMIREEEIKTGGFRTWSLHGFGPAEALALGRKVIPGLLPGEVVIIGIEASRKDGLGRGLSPEVAAAVPRAAGLVLKVLGVVR